MLDGTGAYQIGEVTKREWDLELLLTNDLKFDKHINMVIKKANSILGVIRRNF